MSKTISICGKGGTGKTSFSGLIIRDILSRNKGPVLAVDADPNATLNNALGVESEGSIVAIIDELSKNKMDLPLGMTKERYLEYQIQDSVIEADGFDLLNMGRPEGPGCYCYINNLLRGLIEKLTESYPFIVIDNEAGMEHLSRRTTRSADLLFIVSDYSVVGLRSAKRILGLVKELGLKIGEPYLVINKVTGGLESLKDEIENMGIKMAGVVPLDNALSEANVEGKPLSVLGDDSLIVKAVHKICEETVWR